MKKLFTFLYALVCSLSLMAKKYVQIVVTPEHTNLTYNGCYLQPVIGGIYNIVPTIGDMVITAKCDGYDLETFIINRKSSPNMQINLKPNRKRVMIKDNPETATIFLNGEKVGRGYADFNINKNETKIIKLENEGYNTIEKRINFNDFEDFMQMYLLEMEPIHSSSSHFTDIISTKRKEIKSEKLRSDVDEDIPIVNVINDNTFVLIVANEEYKFLDNVNFASYDGETFKEYCIKTLGIPERQIRYCTNATYGILSDGVDWLSYALNNFEGSRAIVYYCGHGIPDEKTNEAYIIPVDGKGTNTATCYSLNRLYKTLAETKAASITYFMDACFTGTNKEGSMLVAARGVAREAKKETIGGKAVVFSASSGDETAMTYKEKQHGLFTYYLLKKLQETEGNVTYEDLASYISKNVKKDAFLLNEKPQTPVVATSPAAASEWKSMKLK